MSQNNEILTEEEDPNLQHFSEMVAEALIFS